MNRKQLHLLYSRLSGIILFLCMFILSSCDSHKAAKINNIKTWLNKEMGDTTSDFWGSKIFEAFFEMLNTVYKDGFDVLSDAALKLICIAFALWLAFFTLRLVGAFNAPSPADYLNAVFKRGFVVMCFAIFLANPEFLRWLLNHTVVLVIGAFAGTAVNIMNSVLNGVEVTHAVYTDTVSATALANLGNDVTADHLSALKEVFSAVLLACHKQLLFGIAYGKLIKQLSDGVFNKLAGSFMILMFSLVDLMIPLFLMDGLFKFMIAVIMSPLFCAAWVFPSTRGYVKKAWSLVMGMGFQILFTVTYICIAVSCARSFTKKDDVLSILLSTDTFIGDGDSFKAIMEGINSASASAFSLMVCGIFILMMADKMSALANSFTGAPASSIVSDAVKGVMTGAVKLAARIVEAAATIVASIYTGGAAAAAKEAIKLAIKAAIKAAMAAAAKASNSLKKG